jgi:hypothetical protein
VGGRRNLTSRLPQLKAHSFLFQIPPRA